MSRYLHRFMWLKIISTLVAAPAANAEIRFNVSAPVGLRLDIAVAESWRTPASFSTLSDATYAYATSPEKGEENEKPPFPWRTAAPDSPDYRGAAHDTGYFMVFQLAVIGLLYVAPESISGWTDEDKEAYDSNKWKENAQNPERDDDQFIINYVLHPYWGATYYIRGRERGFSRTQSFFFSTGLSFLYEFGFEALFEKPSYQDLWVTPVFGSLIGEFWFSPVRDRIKAKSGELTWQDKTVLFLTDPLGVTSTATDRMLGIDTRVSLYPIDTSPVLRVAGNADDKPIMSSALPPVRTEPAWGLQLKINW